jgi:hypothetical protein
MLGYVTSRNIQRTFGDTHMSCWNKIVIAYLHCMGVKSSKKSAREDICMGLRGTR